MSENSAATLKIATRKSPLAMWQAEFIRRALQRQYPQLDVELLPMTTRGDHLLDTPLAKVGGKGLFVKELELALLEGRADIAVHSTKDVPMTLPEGLSLGAICRRDDPRDALILPRERSPSSTESTCENALELLPEGATVGSSSLRRQCQLLRQRPDLNFSMLRGNINTRLGKLDAGEFDAILLAAAGLQRLGMAERISAMIEPEVILPAVAQGALSIELRDDDVSTQSLLAPLHHRGTALCVAAERAMNRRLNGGCQVPIAGFATWQEGVLSLQGRVAAIDGDQLLRAEHCVEISAATVERDSGSAVSLAENLGDQVAEALLSQGAQSLLDAVFST